MPHIDRVSCRQKNPEKMTLHKQSKREKKAKEKAMSRKPLVNKHTKGS